MNISLELVKLIILKYSVFQLFLFFLFGMRYTDFGMGFGWGFESPLHELITKHRKKEATMFVKVLYIIAIVMLPISVLIVNLFYDRIGKIIE